MSNGQASTGAVDSIGPVLGRVPSGLFIVTWREGDADRVMLTSWLMQAGFEPPAISLAVGHGRQFLTAARTASLRFVVNLLGDTQRNMLGRFGKPPAPGDDPFAGLAITRSPCGAVILPETVGWLECCSRPLAASTPEMEATGDHVLVVANVVGAGTGSAETPLVHLRKSGLHY